MTEKGYRVLEALAIKHPDVIAAVVSTRDRQMKKDYYDEIKELCQAHGFPFYDRQSEFKPDSQYAIAVSWRWMISQSACKLIVFHDSLLPKYRGFNPLVTALIEGDEQVGVTAVLAGTGGYDTGAVIAQSVSEISYPIKIQEAINIITGNYIDLAYRLIAEISRGGEIQGVAQDESRLTYSLWRDEEDYRIDWTKPAAFIRRFVDSVGYPYRGASALVNGLKARVVSAEALEDVIIANRTPGKVLFIEAACPVVVCGQGLLKITGLVSDETGASMLPLSKFRSRFQ